MLGQRDHGLGQTTPHGMDCQRGARQYAQGGVGQRQHSFGMQVAVVQDVYEVQKVVSLEAFPGRGFVQRHTTTILIRSTHTSECEISLSNQDALYGKMRGSLRG